MIDSEKVTIDLQVTEQTKPINEISYGSIFVLEEEFKTENLHKSNGWVVSCESEMMKQPLMKLHMSGDDYLEFRHWCNLAVGLYNGDVYVLPKDIKCKLVAQTLELKNGGLLDDTDN